MGHVKHSQLHLLQEIPQVVVIKRQGALQGGRQSEKEGEDTGGGEDGDVEVEKTFSLGLFLHYNRKKPSPV